MIYIVRNRYRIWDTYENKEQAEEMVRYLNRYYHNGNYIEEVKEDA